MFPLAVLLWACLVLHLLCAHMHGEPCDKTILTDRTTTQRVPSVHWDGALQWCSCWAASRLEVSLFLAAMTDGSQSLLPGASAYCFPQQILPSLQWISVFWDTRDFLNIFILYTLMCQRQCRQSMYMINPNMTLLCALFVKSRVYFLSVNISL